MKSKSILSWFTTVALVSVLSACGGNESQTVKAPPVQAVKLVQVQDRPHNNVFTFPAEVSAVKTIDVSFEVTGRLSQVNLLTASKVSKGDVLAKIDPIPFQRRVKQAEARLEQSRREFKRVTAMSKKKLASQSQLDSATTNLELAEIALNQAKQDLSYTRLTAPFDAQVSERLVDNNNYVRAGETIARLQDVSRYYFNINVPERMLSSYKQGSLVAASAVIVSVPSKQFELEYIEHSTTPDPITQTYKVVFAAPAGEEPLVPGSRARVTVTLSDTNSIDGVLVPFTALIGNDTDGFHVWVYEPETSTVKQVAVQVNHIKDHYALVTGSLKIGDGVVAAGANKMREGLAVKPYLPE